MNDSHGLQNIVSPLYHCVPDTPETGVPHTVALISLLTNLLPDITHTVRPVVLELAQAGGH